MSRHGRRSVLVIAISGCAALSVTAVAPAATNPTAALLKLLPRGGEMTGFLAHGSVHASVNIAGATAFDPPAFKKSDSANLRRDGFRATVYQEQVSATDGGVAGVTELRSAAAAAAYARFTFAASSEPGPAAGSSTQVRFVRFKVPGVPGAEGASQISRIRKGTDSNVQWTEGRCLIQVGDGTTSEQPDASPLIAAAQAIYRRTRGSCR